MEGFYVSIIFLGILLVIFSLAWTALDWKKSRDHGTELTGKKNELAEIINDADEMIQELNRFSDYVVSQISEKQNEVLRFLKETEQKILELESKAKNTAGISLTPASRAAEAYKIQGALSKADVKTKHAAVYEQVEDSEKTAVHEKTEVYENHQFYEKKESGEEKQKVIPLNRKYSNVLMLAGQGLDETEIAKRLGLGKGEIQLILGTSVTTSSVQEAGNNA